MNIAQDESFTQTTTTRRRCKMKHKMLKGMLIAVCSAIFMTAMPAAAGELYFYDYASGQGIIGTTGGDYETWDVTITMASDPDDGTTILKVVLVNVDPVPYKDNEHFAQHKTKSDCTLWVYDSYEEGLVEAFNVINITMTEGFPVKRVQPKSGTPNITEDGNKKWGL